MPGIVAGVPGGALPLAEKTEPPAPPEPTREEKAEVVLNFADDLAVEAISMATAPLGIEWNENLDRFSRLSLLERRRLGRFAPAAYPYVQLIEAGMDRFPKVQLVLLGIGLVASVLGKIKKIRDAVAKGPPKETTPAGSPNHPLPAPTAPAPAAAQPPSLPTVPGPRLAPASTPIPPAPKDVPPRANPFPELLGGAAA